MAGPEEIIFDLHKFDVTFWLRFQDDVFYIWTQAEEKLKYFFVFLNSLGPTIKFTMDYSNGEN